MFDFVTYLQRNSFLQLHFCDSFSLSRRLWSRVRFLLFRPLFSKQQEICYVRADKEWKRGLLKRSLFVLLWGTVRIWHLEVIWFSYIFFIEIEWDNSVNYSPFAVTLIILISMTQNLLKCVRMRVEKQRCIFFARFSLQKVHLCMMS